MKQKKRRVLLYSAVFFLAFVIIGTMIIGATVWSIRASDENVDQAVNSLSAFYMEELVGKREVVLRDSLNQNFDQLDRVISLLESKDIQNQESLRRFLSDAQTLCGAKKLAIVDEDCTVYTAHSTFSDASRYAFLQHDFTEPQIITSNLYGAKKQVVVAVPVENVRIQDKRINACFMQIDIDDVAGSLTYEDKKDAGSTFIGLYYKNGENLTTSRFDNLEPGQNLLTYIRTAQVADDRSVKETEQSFRDGKKGLITLRSDGDTKYIYYIPVEGTDWMLTVMVHDNTIADQMEYTSGVMLRRNLIQLISTALLIIAVFLIIGFQYIRNVDMRRKQQELEVRARNEEELKIARDEAEKANKAKTEFLFNMSHDIRTPMNAIIGFAKIMENELDQPDRIQSHLKKLQESSAYLLSIINNILDMARIESGKTELNTDVMDLLAKENNVLDMFSADFRKKDLQSSSQADITHRYVYADAQKLRQITANLVSNAAKYTPAGGSISVRLKELPCEEPDHASYEMTVSDTGIGMSEEYRKHIFEAFTRERTSTENHVLGTGLGMAIVKRLTDMMGGTVCVDSELGKGTTIKIVTTHRIAPSQEEYTQKMSVSGVEPGSLAGKRILLAEDNDINAEIAMEILEETGVSIERAEDGVVCVDMLSKAEAGYYDMILMDIQMPNMNGYQAAESIRLLPDKEKAAIPIIAMTANAFEEDKRNALKAGMNGHLAKPIDIPKLMETLARVLK